MQLPPPVPTNGQDQSGQQAGQTPLPPMAPPALPQLQGQPPVGQPAQGQPGLNQPHSIGTAAANLAADPSNDLIEKEWVSKAKQIVEQTRDDPYKQSEGLTMMKVDYMKKRYNKTIKYK